jgi:hypothetical protein
MPSLWHYNRRRETIGLKYFCDKCKKLLTSYRFGTIIGAAALNRLGGFDFTLKNSLKQRWKKFQFGTLAPARQKSNKIKGLDQVFHVKHKKADTRPAKKLA